MKIKLKLVSLVATLFASFYLAFGSYLKEEVIHSNYHNEAKLKKKYLEKERESSLRNHHKLNRKLNEGGSLYSDESLTFKPAQAKTLDIGGFHTCVINTDDDVLCWGDNQYGQLGIGTNTFTTAVNTVPVDLGDGRVPKKIYTSLQFTCVLFESEDLACWGFNFEGQLGIGSKAHVGTMSNHMGNNLQTIDFGVGRKVRKVVLGMLHSCAILDNEGLKCWGHNNFMQLGYPDTASRGIGPYQMGDRLPLVDFGDRLVKEVSVGDASTCVLLENTLSIKEGICWGYNFYGQLGRGNKDSAFNPGTLAPIDFGGPITSLQTSKSVTCALLENKRVKCVGYNGKGGLGIGSTSNIGDDAAEVGDGIPYANFGAGNVKELHVIGYSPCVVLEDNRLKCWGENSLCTVGIERSENIGVDSSSIGDQLPAIDLGGRTIKELKGFHYTRGVILSDDTFTAWGAGLGTGCIPGDMGNNLPKFSLPCVKNKLSIVVGTEAYSDHTSIELKYLSSDKLVMKAREGHYSMENQVYNHDICAPDGTYEVKIEHSLGNWSGSYEISYKGNLITRQHPDGYFWQDRYIFSSCFTDDHCDDQFSCTTDSCDISTSTCQFKASFSSDCRSYGSPLALVIRSLTTDSNTTNTLSELSKRFFGLGEGLSLRSQFLACSHELYNITPFTGNSLTNVSIVDGAIDIMLHETSSGKAASTISTKILQKAANELGELSSQFDFVIVCLPPGAIVGDSPYWKAYAYVDGYVSIYNDKNCIYPSVQMHEIGHNLGLSHSNDEANYGDTSGVMGISYSLLNGPAKCFNAPKSLQLKWYVDGDLTLDVKNIIGKEVHLVGITDYLEKGFKSTHLKVINCQNGYDYFLSLNRKIRMNSGTSEGGDQILVSRRRVGDYYDDSKLIAQLNHLQKFTIYGLGPGGSWNLQIMPNILLDEEPSWGRVSFSLGSQQCLAKENCNDNNYCTDDECTFSEGELICSHNPKNCSDCGATLYLELTTNDSPHEILWDIENVHTKRIVRSSSYYKDIFTSYNFTDCFEYGMYVFSIYYTNSTKEFYQNATFKLSIGEEKLDSGNITEMIYAETIFTICTMDSDCLDYDGCTIDICDTGTRLCNNSYVPLSKECINCFWAYFNLTTDNFAEETKWKIVDVETGLLVESGDPYPTYFHAFGRRNAPTQAGRRKAPTKSGRRKAPTKSGRRKAPTRSSALISVNGAFRNLDEHEDNEIYRAICMETSIKYKYIITDSFGDGICCAEGEGSFAVTLEDKIIKKGGNFSSHEEISFKFTSSEAACDDNDPGTRYEFHPEINACLYYPVICNEYGAMTIISIKSDIYAEDTIWQVAGNDTVEMKGSLYDLAYSTYETKKCLPYGSYTFSVVDPPADGMAFCFEHECGYELTINNRTVKKSDGSFGMSSNHTFSICSSDQECNDDDLCTFDSCDLTNRVCIFESLACSECSKETVMVDINTDILFSLTAWNLIDTRSNTSIASAGPFVKSYTHYQKSICLVPGIYIFSVTNSKGRGMIICRNGFNCGYSVTVNNETVIESDGSFEYEVTHSFTICDTDNDCENDDPCTLGQCKNTTKVCQFDRMPCAACNKKSLKISIDTDGNAAETSWILVSSQNHSKFASGGKYARSYTHYVYDECIPKGDYVYSIFDEVGDGLMSCLRNGTTCGYSVAIDDEVILDSAGDFGSTLSHFIKLCDNETSCDTITSTFIPKPSPIAATSSSAYIEYLEIQSFVTGFFHTCALTNKHVIFCWGDNSFGQLGYGDTINRAKTGSDLPSVNVGEGVIAKQIHSGAFHTCIITFEDDVMCWGDNSFGKLGIGSTVNIGAFDGQMGNALKKVDLGLGRKVRKLSLGYQHSCALLDNNIIKCWGNNEFGQLGTGNPDTIGDEPYEMGNNLTVIELGSYENVQDISAGSHHTCALQAFEVRCWGKNSNGQLGYGDKIDRGSKGDSMGANLPVVNIGAIPVKLSAGNSMTCVIINDGQAKCFGYNKFGQLGYGDKLERGGNQTEMGNHLPYLDIGDNENIVYLTRGSYSICALLSNSKVKCWGFGLECSLGLGDDKDRFTTEDLGNNLPYVNLGNRIVKEIQMYHWHGCALYDDHKLSCWGYNRYGQLGNGHKESVGCNAAELGVNTIPVNISDPSPFKIKVDSVSTNELDEGISIEYNVSKSFSLTKFASRVYEKTCTLKSNSTSIFVAKSKLELKPYEAQDKAITTIGLDYKSVRSSQFWSDLSDLKGGFEFCIVSEMYFDETQTVGVSFAETIISLSVDFEGNFNITNSQLSKKDVVDVIDGTHFQVEACLCNNDHICNQDPRIYQNSEITLCIHPYDELQVTKFQTVNFYQDGILKFKAVENGEGKLLTNIKIEGEYGVLETRLISDFFRTPNPSPAEVNGEVYLDFRVQASGRYLLKTHQATFSLNISLRDKESVGTTGLKNLLLIIIIVCAGFIILQKSRRKIVLYSSVECDKM